MSLRFKLLLIISIFLIFPFLTVLYVWLQSSSDTIERNAADYGKVLVKQTGDYIDSYFRDLERDTAPLLVMTSIREFMRLEAANGFEYYRVTNQVDADINQSSMYRRHEFQGIDLFSGNGISFTTRAQRNFFWDDYEKALSRRNTDRTYDIDGIVKVNGTPMLSYYRYYSDYVYRDIKSMIVLYLDLNPIGTISSNTLLRGSGFLWIVDRNGDYIYHPDSKLPGTKADQSYIKPLGEGTIDFIENVSGGKKLIVQQRSEYTGWLLVYEVPLRALSGDLLRLQQITTLVIVCMIAVVLIILGGFAYYLTRRIVHLQKLMRQAEGGDLLVKAPEDSRDELGRLYGSFNRMLLEIRRLIEELKASHAKENELQERQRKTTIEVMQSQINPHFLYNTLEVINAHAILEGVKPISSMALSLSKMFRYSVNNNEPIVTLYSELEHIRWYANILEERHESLRVVFDIDKEAAKAVACVRLSLQPLVENAFLHGYEKNGWEPDLIVIRGERSESGYDVFICDNGIGMPEDKVREYNEAFRMSTSRLAEAHQQPKGVGLWNVHRRIRLTFAEPYGLSIGETSSEGCEIRIKLPIMLPGARS